MNNVRRANYIDHEPSPGAWISLNETTYMHGKHSWYVEGASSQDVVIDQTLSSGVVEYIRNRKANQQHGVCFSFWYKPESVIENGTYKGEKNKAYAEIYYTYPGGSNTVSGDTVKPDNKTKWWHALVYASLPTNTQTVKVRIVGKPYSGEV